MLLGTRASTDSDTQARLARVQEFLKTAKSMDLLKQVGFYVTFDQGNTLKPSDAILASSATSKLHLAKQLLALVRQLHELVVRRHESKP